MRLQLALNVRDIDAAVDYYSKLFGVKPHKHYDSYANFAIQQPPLKLVLFRNPEAQERLHHVGVEVMDDSSVRTTLRRLTEAGVVDEVQRDETCCHATQDKIWSREPDGLRWEWYGSPTTRRSRRWTAWARPAARRLRAMATAAAGKINPLAERQ